MKKALNAICLILCPFILSGCFQHKAFNKEINRNIIRIGVLEPAHKGELEVMNLNNPGLLFGLVGGTIAAVDAEQKKNRFMETLKSDLSLVDEYKSIVVSGLQASGYQVIIIPIKRLHPILLHEYTELPKNVDAYLDTSLHGGFYFDSEEQSYVPLLRTNARLVNTSTDEVLYEERTAYGYKWPITDAHISCDQQYSFKSFEELVANSDKASEGLRKGIPLVANKIIRSLAR